MSKAGKRERGPGPPDGGGTGPAPFVASVDAVVSDTQGFVAAASLVFGGHGWVGETARCMGVNEATVWRWVNVSPVPPGPALAAMTAWVRLHALGYFVPSPIEPD